VGDLSRLAALFLGIAHSLLPATRADLLARWLRLSVAGSQIDPAGRFVHRKVLLALLKRGPRTWRELAQAGLSRADVFGALDDLAAAGDAIFRVGPLLVERVDYLADELGGQS